MRKVDVNLSQPSLVWHLLGCHCQKDRVALSSVLSGLWYSLEHYWVGGSFLCPGVLCGLLGTQRNVTARVELLLCRYSVFVVYFVLHFRVPILCTSLIFKNETILTAGTL